MAARQKKRGAALWRILRRLLLVLITLVLMVTAGAYVLLRQIFRGPSPAARDAVTVSMMQSEYTEWIPGLFLSDRQIDDICGKMTSILPANVSDPGLILPGSAAWSSDPDGIRLEEYEAAGFRAYMLIVRDPAQVSLSYRPQGDTIHNHLTRSGAAAAVNAGAFLQEDDRSLALGLVISGGSAVSDSGSAPEAGFAGFNADHVLIVAGSMTAGEAQQLGIRDGCACGPVLIMDGQINEGAYNANSGVASRSCIGQRADGSVVFLYTTGPLSGDAGATWQDCIDILYEYNCINACSLDSTAVMLHTDGNGTAAVGTDSPLRAESAMLPDVWVIRPGEEG